MEDVEGVGEGVALCERGPVVVCSWNVEVGIPRGHRAMENWNMSAAGAGPAVVVGRPTLLDAWRQEVTR